MAQFIGYIKGQRGEASRLGTKNSGLRVTANGWDIGAVVELDHVSSLGPNGTDVVHVYLTGGSNGGRSRQHVGSWRLSPEGNLEPCTSIGTTV